MKKLVLLLFVVGLIGCKTTEENYQKSYQAAIAKAREKDSEGIDPTTYNKILEQSRSLRKRLLAVILSGNLRAMHGNFTEMIFP